MVAPPWEIVLYETRNNRFPAEEFLAGLAPTSQTLVVKGLERLAQYGTELGRPYVGYLRDHIWELRVRTNEGRCRILFFRDRDKLVMLQGFIKTATRVPDVEIDRAVEFREDYSAKKKRGSQ